MENHANRPEVRAALSGPAGQSIRYSRTLGWDQVYLAQPIHRGKRVLAVIRLSLPLRVVNQRLGYATNSLLIVIGVVGGVALLLLLGLVNSLVQPIRRLSFAARRIAGGDLSQRVRIPPGDEIGELARAFNRMAGNLEEQLAQIRETEGTLRAAFAHMADGVAVLDAEGRVLLFNPVAEEAFGSPGEKAKGRLLLEIALHPELDRLVTQALRTGAQCSGEIQLRRPAFRILRTFVTPMAIEVSSPLGAVMIFQDLTELRRLEGVRQDFVANASHELKTPLSTIRVMVDTLRSPGTQDEETAARYLSHIGAEVQRMGALVDDMLHLSRLDEGAASMEREVISLNRALESVFERLRPRAEQRRQTLTYNPEGAPLVWADPAGLLQIAENLVDNAIKYTPEGGRIDVSSGHRGGDVYFQVTDTGVGIPKEEQARVFERFYRVDKARSRATGGTGLGLSIVKHWLELHGGTWELESEIGRGSRFTVVLPAPPAEFPSGQPADVSITEWA
jgi:two-component system phosphate regulon sensor histidine kinase PhoR